MDILIICWSEVQTCRKVTRVPDTSFEVVARHNLGRYLIETCGGNYSLLECFLPLSTTILFHQNLSIVLFVFHFSSSIMLVFYSCNYCERGKSEISALGVRTLPKAHILMCPSFLLSFVVAPNFAPLCKLVHTYISKNFKFCYPIISILIGETTSISLKQFNNLVDAPNYDYIAYLGCRRNEKRMQFVNFTTTFTLLIL